MIIRDIQKGDEIVRELKAIVEAKSFTLQWKWPKDSDLVYLYKVNAMDDINLGNVSEKNLKLYTKEEYKQFKGYVERIKEISQYKYIVFPAVEAAGKTIVIKQFDKHNQVLVCTGKPEIIYTVSEHKKIFSSRKIIKITIRSKFALRKEVLCYVKKQGSYPVSIEDGMKFEFITNFHAGENEQQPIEVAKDEYIRVFLKEIKDYSDMYTLIRK